MASSLVFSGPMVGGVTMRRAMALGLVGITFLLAGCGGYIPGHDPADPMVVKLAAIRATVPIGDSIQLSAVVTGAGPDTVQWSVNGIVGGNSIFGTISNTGLYTTPAAVPSEPTITLTARSVAD